MKKLQLLIASAILMCSNIAMAQSLESNTQWLSSQLNKLVIDEKSKEHDDAITSFKFKGCKMNMNVDTRESDVNFGINISWFLKDVEKVYYTKEKDSSYELRLNVPADRIKMRVGFGRDHAIGGSFRLKNDDEPGNSNFSLHTKDERLVKEIVNKFEDSVRMCKNTK